VEGMPESNHPFLVSGSQERQSGKTMDETLHSEGKTLRYHDLLSLLEWTEEWLASPRPEPGSLPGNLKILNHSQLINLVNAKNFFGQEIFLVFSRPRQKRLLLLPVDPSPIQNDRVDCLLKDPKGTLALPRDSRLVCLLMDEGRSVVIVKPEEVLFEDDRLGLRIPCKGIEVASRKTRRFLCPSIPAQLLQDGFSCPGRLATFSVTNLQAVISESELPQWNWINSDKPLTIQLRGESGEVFYAGGVTIFKEWDQQRDRVVVLRLLENGFERVKKREVRTDRFTLSPSPNIVFQHPLIKKRIKLPVQDISITGFSVEEEETENANLIPGLILPEITIEFPDLSCLKCRGQIVYRQRTNGVRLHFGFYILHISTEDHLKLSNLLNKEINQNVEMGGPIDFESLWALFFRSGFIYPRKYQRIARNKQRLAEIYRNACIDHPEITRHFTYQERGEIKGHIGMLRVYENAWMIHHYAADPGFRYKKVGLTLLYQLHRYINDSLNLTQSRMKYIICYFQPTNKFSNLIFGGAVRKISNLAAYSQDCLAFMNYPEYLRPEVLSEPWVIEKAGPEDMEKLADFYQDRSGGLLLEALDLKPSLLGVDTLGPAYARAGLHRKREVLAVRYNKNPKIVLSITRTNIGLNLSELTNSVTMIILDPDHLPFDVFLKVLSWLGSRFPIQEMPIMIFPHEYLENNNFQYERAYNLWVGNTERIDLYSRYLQDVFFKFKLF
jgi:hypothetical protein